MRKGTFVLEEIWEVIGDRLARPAPGSYVGGLVHGEKGIDRVLEKVGEEATEFVLAVKNGEKGRIVEEAADLQFHLLPDVARADLLGAQLRSRFGTPRVTPAAVDQRNP